MTASPAVGSTGDRAWPRAPEPQAGPSWCWILHGQISTPPGPVGSCQQLQVLGWDTPHGHPLNLIEGPREAVEQHPMVCGTAWCGSDPDHGWGVARAGNSRAGQDGVRRDLLNQIYEGCDPEGDEFCFQMSTCWWEMSPRLPPQKFLLL